MAAHLRTHGEDRWRNHCYRVRVKRGGWYGRRFGKNPRHANKAMDAFRQAQRTSRTSARAY
jgi:hypothetical protein